MKELLEYKYLIPLALLLGNGFSVEEFSGMLEKTGFSSISISTAAKIVKGDRTFPVLLATTQSGRV